MQAITDSDFKAEVVDSPIPVLVDFWAEWCGPCKALSPVLDQLSAEYAGRVKFVKVNVDDEPGAPTEYGIRNLPTVTLFKDGKPVSSSVGAKPRSAIKAWLDAAVG